jgi:hypothetical protein
MGNLLIGILSIALFGLLALYAGSFLGDAFKNRSAEATAAGFLTQGSQVLGAFDVANFDNVAVTSIQDLVDADPSYLDSVPVFDGDAMILDTTDVEYVRADVTEAVCAAVVAKTGSAQTPAADKTAAQTQEIVNSSVGCITSADASGGAAYYKVK